MKKTVKTIAVAGGLLLAMQTTGGTARAAEYTVPGSFPTIQGALDAAVAGDTILVGPGTYYEHLSITKQITLKSTDGAVATILDGSGVNGAVVSIVGQAAFSTVDGFTVTNGLNGGFYIWQADPTIRNTIITNNTSYNGAGLWAYYGACWATLENVIFTNNHATNDGGAAYGNIACVTISNSKITGNTAGNNGGALASEGYCGGVNAFQTEISGNSAGNAGGGLFLGYGSTACSPSIGAVNSLVTGNSAQYGGGVYLSGSGYGRFSGSTITKNTATVAGGGFYSDSTANYNLNSAILWDNNLPPVLGPQGQVTYSDIEGGVPFEFEGNGNISTDPFFVDPQSGNFQLSQGSPAIDSALMTETGFPTFLDTDMLGRPRVQGAAMDMGAYEFADVTPPVTTAAVAGSATTTGWYASPAIVTLSATDLSGIRELRYVLDGGAEVVVTGESAEIQVTADGIHTLSYYAIDKINNPEAVKTITINIDTVAPELDATVSGTVGTSGWYRSAASLMLAATDATSGVKEIRYSINGGSAVVVSAATATVSLPVNTVSTVSYWAVDQAGNQGAVSTQTISSDAVAPGVSVSVSTTEIDDDNRLHSVKISGSTSDSLSGIASTSIVVTDKNGVIVATAAAFGSTVQLRGVENQVYTVTATSIDNAGNSSSAKARVEVD